MKIRSKLGFMHQEFALTHYATVLSQLSTRLGYKKQDIVNEARARAEKLGLSEELLDSFYLLTDLPESEAKERLRQVGLDGEILNDLFPRFPETATKEAVADMAMARQGKRVAVLDADITGPSAPTAFGVTERRCWRAARWRFRVHSRRRYTDRCRTAGHWQLRKRAEWGM